MSFLKRFQISLDSLYQLPENAKYVIAYSGGVDSHVLLHCCKKLNLPVRAVHVHHGLQSMADDWVEHCQFICAASNIPLDIAYVDAKKKQGQSPEETARRVRYEALEANLQGDECLLTAQHINDQAETLLLQLFRSAGSAGLAAMPASKRLGHPSGHHMHLRPLLSFSRQEIVAYAKENTLHWMEDPSNQDVRYDRNFVRKNLMPLLENRWPEILAQLSTVAELQSNNLQVLEDMAAIDLANAVKVPEYPVESWMSKTWMTNTQMTNAWGSKICAYDIVSVLSISALKQLSYSRLLNVLRYWIMHTGKMQSEKISPTRNLLEEIEKTMIHSQQDANPVITFSDFEYRKYQNNLFCLKPKSFRSVQKNLQWNPSSPLEMPGLDCRIQAIKAIGEGLKEHLLNENLMVSFRQGGEQFHPVGRGHSQSLKKLFQEANIPPWERDLTPLLYWGDKLIAVIGFWISKQYAVAENESGWIIEVDVVTRQR